MSSRGIAAGASARPFPWASLDSTTHAAIGARAALRRFAEHEEASAIVRALEAMTGTRVDVRLRRVDVTTARGGAERALPGAFAIAIEEPDATRTGDAEPTQPSARLWVEVEPELATAIVACALRRAAPRVPVASPSPRMAGALAAVVAAALRRAQSSRPLRVLAAGLASEVWPARSEDAIVIATVTVVLGDDAFLARVATTRATLDALPSVRREDGAGTANAVAALAAVGEVRLAVPVVLAMSLASREELSALAVGDAWMPGLRGRAGVAGPVLLAAASSDRGARADLGDDGRLVVRDGSEDLSMAGDNVVSENAAEAPVVVRVEIGAVELPARAWAAVAPGDVVALAHRVADPVVLRANGVEVARGELVEIEGEVGVRILSLTGKT
ncbi:MAG: Type secretion inner rane protein [Myxococcaceae bacterium]|nr:Type secretion inner rane protein [Myxococcaceae bacterium]